MLLVPSRDPGRGRGAEGTLRGDLDRAEIARLEGEASAARRDAAIVERLAALETKFDRLPESPSRAATAEALAALADDLRALRDVVRRDLESAELRLTILERRLDEVVSLLPPAVVSGSVDGGAVDGGAEDEEAVWVNLARDPDPLRRFSALTRLGRARTDRSVRASVEALRDPDAGVVWQALRNLGAFTERPAAREVAALLDHAETVVRHAAWEALVRMGAPESGFHAADEAAARREPAARLRAWAEEE